MIKEVIMKYEWSNVKLWIKVIMNDELWMINDKCGTKCGNNG